MRVRLFSTLCKPVAYIQVKQKAKRRLDYTTTLVGAALGLLLSCRTSVNIFGHDGLITGMNGLFQALPGFYIAALAAIATFGGSKKGYDLDAVLPPPSATLEEADGCDRPLTRRHFLALLFGYLSFSSLALYFLGVIAGLLAPDLRGSFPPLNFWLRVAFSGFYVGWIAHVIGSTVLGLYFLSHRLHSTVPVRPHGLVLGKREGVDMH